MRNPTLPGADGPANLTAAVQVAASGAARGRGALVVFSDEIHAARLVRKTHSTSTATFVSPDAGPVGQVVEGVPRFLAEVRRRRPGHRVLAETSLARDQDRALHRDAGRRWHAARPGGETHHGLVVAGFGVGHVPAALAPLLGELAAVMPVVLTSRAGAGPVLAATYGAAGSERDLRARPDQRRLRPPVQGPGAAAAAGRPGREHRCYRRRVRGNWLNQDQAGPGGGRRARLTGRRCAAGDQIGESMRCGSGRASTTATRSVRRGADARNCLVVITLGDIRGDPAGRAEAQRVELRSAAGVAEHPRGAAVVCLRCPGLAPFR